MSLSRQHAGRPDGGAGRRALSTARPTCRRSPASLQLEVDELLPIAEGLQLLGFAELAEGDITLTEAGRHFVDSDLEQRKRMFAEHLRRQVPLAAHIRRVLDERPGHRAPRVRFETELEDQLSEEDAAGDPADGDLLGPLRRALLL